MAQIHHQINHLDDALSSVLRAEHEAPEQVRYHFIARELVLTWMRERRSRGRTDIATLAQRLRVG